MSNNWTDPALGGYRADGTPKGQGYFGVLKRPDGSVSSELSIGVNINGQEVEIPALVPTLNQAEISHLLNSPANSPMPPSIVQKAVDFARQRQQQQRPYFAQPGEQNVTTFGALFPRSHVTSMGASLMAPSHGTDSGATSRPDNLAEAMRLLMMSKLRGEG